MFFFVFRPRKRRTVDLCGHFDKATAAPATLGGSRTKNYHHLLRARSNDLNYHQ